MGANSPQAGFGEGAFKGPSHIANTINLLRIIEAVGAALSEMKRAEGRAVNAQNDLTG